MKRFLSKLAVLVMVFAMLSAFSFIPTSAHYTNLNQPTGLQNPVYAPMGVEEPDLKVTPKPQRAIEVHNAAEFFRALKPNVTIKLLPGDYNLGKVKRTKYAFYNKTGFGYYSVQGATLKNLKNVRVFSDTKVLMYSSQERDGIMFDNVLTLMNCSNVIFENITFGHISKNEDTLLSCLAGVISLYKCENVKIKKCDLFGCGYTGLNMEKCKSITVDGSKIYDCETSAFWMNGCKDVSFLNTEICNNGIDNTWCKLGEIVDSTDLTLSLCNIHDNGFTESASGGLFAIYGKSEQPTLDQCTLTNNKY